VIRRTLFATAVLTAVIAGANCSFHVPAPCRSNLNTLFEGCFEGEITDPTSGGKITVILDTAGQPETDVLSGCLEAQLSSGPVSVSLAGTVSCQPDTEATLTGMLAGGETVAFTIVRQPSAGNAVTVDVTTDAGAPFASATGLARCTMPRPCPAVGMLIPGGQP
jgi:hypothetical protein